jgi:hypothetical protein
LDFSTEKLVLSHGDSLWELMTQHYYWVLGIDENQAVPSFLSCIQEKEKNYNPK